MYETMLSDVRFGKRGGYSPYQGTSLQSPVRLMVAVWRNSNACDPRLLPYTEYPSGPSSNTLAVLPLPKGKRAADPSI